MNAAPRKRDATAKRKKMKGFFGDGANLDWRLFS